MKNINKLLLLFLFSPPTPLSRQQALHWIDGGRARVRVGARHGRAAGPRAAPVRIAPTVVRRQNRGKDAEGFRAGQARVPGLGRRILLG